MDTSGASGGSGTAGFGGGAGAQGFLTPSAGDGGRGGNGGAGGAGGDGGQGAGGGTAGGGAGGTVKIFGSVIEASGAVTSATGGGSSGNTAPGSAGRVVIGNNVASGAPAVFDDPTIAGAELASFDGARDVNPYIKTPTQTPFIPDLADGAEIFGILAGVDANDSFYDFLRASAPDRAIGAFVQSDIGPAGYSDDYTGFDFFSVVNLTDEDLTAPKLGIDFADFGFFEPLKVGGWERDPANGGTGDEILSVLGGLSVWATLVPEANNGVNLSASGLSIFPSTFGGKTTFGYLVAPIPLPAPLALMLAGLGSLVVVRRRRARG